MTSENNDVQINETDEGLYIGKNFDSYEEIENEMNKLMKSTKSTFVRNNSKLLSTVCSGTNYNTKLIFHELYMKCNRSGKPNKNEDSQQADDNLRDTTNKRKIRQRYIKYTTLLFSNNFNFTKKNTLFKIPE